MTLDQTVENQYNSPGTKIYIVDSRVIYRIDNFPRKVDTFNNSMLCILLDAWIANSRVSRVVFSRKACQSVGSGAVQDIGLMDGSRNDRRALNEAICLVQILALTAYFVRGYVASEQNQGLVERQNADSQ